MGIEFFFSIFLLFYLSRKSVTRFSKTIYGSKVQNSDDDAHCAKTWNIFQFSLHNDLNSMIHGKINTVIDLALLTIKNQVLILARF